MIQNAAKVLSEAKGKTNIPKSLQNTLNQPKPIGSLPPFFIKTTSKLTNSLLFRKTTDERLRKPSYAAQHEDGRDGVCGASHV